MSRPGRTAQALAWVAVALSLPAPVRAAGAAPSVEGSAPVAVGDPGTVVLWHAYRGAEAAGLDAAVARFRAEYPDGPRVDVLAVPHEALRSKLSSAIPRGHGPDLFIFAHELVGDWATKGLLAPLPGPPPASTFYPTTVDALRYDGRIWGWPMAYKSVALFYRRDRLEAPPGTVDELLAAASAHSDATSGRYGLAYEAGAFYYHAPWMHAFGGAVISPDGKVTLHTPENATSLAFAHTLVRELRVTPEEANGALVAELFNSGRAAMVINGPWFVGEIADDVPWGVAPMPMFGERPASPFLTVEALFLSARAGNPEAARAVAAFLAAGVGAIVRAEAGQLVAARGIPLADARLTAFQDQLADAVPMPNVPAMGAVWEPAAQALRKVLRDAATPDEALRAAEVHFAAISRPLPPPANPLWFGVGLFLLVAAAIAVRRALRKARGEETPAAASTTQAEPLAKRLRAALPAYAYLAPGAIAMLVLVLVPFVVGSGLSVFAHRAGELRFVGFTNFSDILLSRDYPITSPLSFYFTLLVTVGWTAANVALHVTLGVAFALLLRDPLLKLRGVYRILLIVPWAVPNYITALIWKGMFHKQFGAINGLLTTLGLEPVSWFGHFSTSFAANVVTNTWLGFPFMMVVTLGALAAIPKELEQAAEVDGASRWQRFRHVTLPLLRPALAPAVVLGTIWTFNMFNIVYLVSGGEPDGATEILISEAYRWAFSRQEQYGIAAAYAVLIFFILLATTRGLGRLAEAQQT